MNCPSCGNRNPSTADHCLHCGAPFANKQQGGGFFDIESDSPDSFWTGSKPFVAFAGVIATIVIGSMVLFGFDTYDANCTTSQSQAAGYEASEEWERDTSAERRWRDRKERQHRERTGSRTRTYRDRYVRCYRKFTGHVDGIVE